jgi:fucose 4-O-acetylase-like acetyltransferase
MPPRATSSEAGVPPIPSAPLARPARAELQRDESLDIAKGFGIILVVLGHCLDGLVDSRFFPAGVLWLVLAIYVIYTFHMPLFFVVSGHLASGKHRPASTTIARLVPSIVYPYFLWSILQDLVQIYLSKSNHFPITSLYKILWIPPVPYWFLYSLFFCHVGYLAIRNLAPRMQLLIAIVAFTLPIFFIQQLSQAYLQIVLDTVRGFLYFVLGALTVAQVKRFGRGTAITTTLFFVIAATVFHLSGLGGAAGTVAVVPVALSGIAATLAWSRLLTAHPGRLVSKLVYGLAFLGRYSMSIYVMHIFFTAGVRIGLKHLAIHPALLTTIIEVTAATVLGTLAPLAINWILSKWNLDKWFGIQHMEVA